ncbi:MAG: FG-GAP-like repeat-containing protein, partial [candidate division WOR-3 bacterium]
FGSCGYILCGDTDHNGLSELIFSTGSLRNYIRWEIWEYRPLNRYEIVFADTYRDPNNPPPGIHTGGFCPLDIGDIDSDGLTDLIGLNFRFGGPHVEAVIHTMESRTPFSYPDTMTWVHTPGFDMIEVYITDLDGDGKKEIFYGYVGSYPEQTRIFEARGNNQYELVHLDSLGGYVYAFADFDQDGKMEYATMPIYMSSHARIFECVGDDQYVLACSTYVPRPDPAAPYDIFSGLGWDGKPRFFIAFHRCGIVSTYYLYMGKAIGNNSYEITFIDSMRNTDNWGRRSKCGDVDGDGMEEVIWSIGPLLKVYKAFGNDRYQPVWRWDNPYGSCSLVNLYDMNGNGYPEIIVSGNESTHIFEVEAVRLNHPNGFQIFFPGDTVRITWRTFKPPTCDSLSLFFSSDNGNTYEVIATGISDADTSYLWRVPNVRSDSCLIKVIAYGPGWQYDESDAFFAIFPTGIGERKDKIATGKTFLETPTILQRGKVQIKYQIGKESDLNLFISDASGRIVKSLFKGKQKPGSYTFTWDDKEISPGIYFCTLATDSFLQTKKIIITK